MPFFVAQSRLLVLPPPPVTARQQALLASMEMYSAIENSRLICHFLSAHTVALQKGLEAPVGEVVVDEQPLAVGVAVAPEADDVAVPEPADEPHVAVEGLAPAGELQGAEPLHGRHDAVLEDGLVRAPGHALAEHLRRGLEQALQPQLLAAVEADQGAALLALLFTTPDLVFLLEAKRRTGFGIVVRGPQLSSHVDEHGHRDGQRDRYQHCIANASGHECGHAKLTESSITGRARTATRCICCCSRRLSDTSGSI
uniref:Uncharacterized protein n=1 Tax=Triticum urartu TaxID=4572 RepID=A0A8R7PCR3_TRIUA